MQVDQINTGKRRHDDENHSEGWKTIESRKKHFPNSPASSKDAEPKTKNPKIPPFFIEPIKHWNNLFIILKQQAPFIHWNMNKNYIRVSVETELQYRKVQKILTDERIHYRSFLLENEKTLNLFREVFQLTLISP